MTPEVIVNNAAVGRAGGAGETSKLRVDAQNPWPGADAYDEAASAYFYGRDRESRELFRLIKLGPLTVVYGKSGLGKTSLLQAGLFPLLRQQHYLPVLKRMDFEQTGDTPLEQIKVALQQALDQAGIPYPPMDSGQSLWEYLHRKDSEFIGADGEAVIPVLVLDQFEELFSRTRGNDKIVQQVFFDLADLIENRIPSELTGREARERRAELDILSQRYRVVLSFREDFIPMIRSWEKQVPSLLRNYLRLEPMSRVQAIDAVNQAGAAVLEPDVAPDIVDLVCQADQAKAATDTSDVVVEPVLLSLCCTQLNRRRPADKLVDKKLVEDAGQDILESFYSTALEDPAVQGAPDAAGFIENYLIQGDRFRGDYPRQEALDEGKLRLDQLVALTDKHRLLRIINRGDTPRIELIHDRLVPVVKKARDQRSLQAEKAEQEEKARQAEQELDDQRKRSAELKRERDRARLLGALVAVVCIVCVGVLILALREKQARIETKAEKELVVGITRLAEGREALPGQTQALDRAIYKALAAYRLSRFESEMQDTQDLSLAAISHVLASTGRLAKLIRLPGLKPTDAMKYSPDGKLLAVGGEDGLVWILDAHNLDAKRYIDTIRRLDCEQGKTPGDAKKLDSVSWVDFNSDGSRLAAVYADGSQRGLVCIFDMKDPKVKPRRWSLSDHQKKGTSFYTVAYGGERDQQYLLFGGEDGILRRWDLQTGQVSPVNVESDLPDDQKKERPKGIMSVALSSDYRKFAVGKDDGSIEIWNTADWTKGATLRLKEEQSHGGSTKSISEVEFSTVDPEQLVSGRRDGYVDLWNVRGTGCRVAELKLKTSVESVAIKVFKETVIAAGTGRGYVEFFKVTNNAGCSKGDPPKLEWIKGATLKGHGGVVKSAVFNLKERQMASVGQDGTIRFWADHSISFALRELHLKSQTPANGDAPAEINTMAVSPDGKFVAAGDNKGLLHMWHGPSTSVWKAGDKNDTPYDDWQAEKQGAVNDLVFVPSGNGLLLVSAGDDGIVRRWRAGTNEPVGPGLVDSKDEKQAIYSLALSPDGKTLAAGSDDGTVRLWNMALGTSTKIPKPNDVDAYFLSAVGYTSDGRYLAIGSEWDHRLRIVDLKSPGQQPAERMLEGHTSGVSSIVHGPNSQKNTEWLMSAGLSGSVLEWAKNAVSDHSEDNGEINTVKVKLRLGTPELRPTDPVTALDISPDGRYILTGGVAGQIEVWDGVSHVLLSDELLGYGSPIADAVIWSKEKDMLLFTAEDDKILVWPGPDTWADILCQKLVWNMSDKQWDEWVPGVKYREQCPNLPKWPASAGQKNH